MKREDVRLGMVVYDKKYGTYASVLEVEKDTGDVRMTDGKHSATWSPATNLRPLTKRERGER